MTRISGTYFNGKIEPDQSPETLKPMKVKVIFEEEENSTKRLRLSDLSFSKSQELLKYIKSSFSDEVVKERDEY